MSTVLEKISGKTLVLYVFHEYNDRVKQFINNAIFYDKNTDFIVISNNREINFETPNYVKKLFRDNVGYDFGGWSEAILTDDLYKNYDHFIFVNSSVNGPYLHQDYHGLWTDIFIRGLTGNVKLFGSTINTCRSPRIRSHIQSYIFAMDKQTLEYLIKCEIFSSVNQAKTMYEAIENKEVLMSRKVIENGWNIGSLMKYYKDIDFTFSDKSPEEYSIDFLDDVMYDPWKGRLWNEHEIVFIKGNRIQSHLNDLYNIPDCTVVSACFDINKYHNKCLDHDTIIERINILLELPVYLVIYTNIASHVIEKRRQLGFEELTQVIDIPIENIWAFQYVEKMKKNRELYYPTKDERTCAESHAICVNKFQFVLETIEKNPFKTSKFAWMDAFCGTKDNMKICQNYTPSKILYVLNNISDKYHIEIINVNDKKYKLAENKREFYSTYKYVVAGSFFTCGKDVGVKILTRLNEIFIETTELGYGHGEEMFYLEVLDEFYDDIVKSYGDYGQIINNFFRPTENIGYIYNFILNNYLGLGYNRECYECCKTVLHEIENHHVDIDYCIYTKILYAYYVASFYYKPEETVNICNHIYDLYNTNPYIRQHKSEMPFEQLLLCNIMKPSYDVIFCIFGCVTHPKYKEQVKKIEETWGAQAAKHGNIKILYFFGEERVDDMIDDSKYIYLKGVNNVYNSAAHKQSRGLQYIYENYNTEFIHCCGTDTYINIEKFIKYLDEIKSGGRGEVSHYKVNTPYLEENKWIEQAVFDGIDNNKALYIGGHGDYRRLNDNDPKYYFFHSGGPGFIINKKTIQMIYPYLHDMILRWKKFAYEYLHPACDVMISYYIHEIGSIEIISNRYVFFNCNFNGSINEGNCCREKSDITNVIACHNMTLCDFDDYTRILHDNGFFLKKKAC